MSHQSFTKTLLLFSSMNLKMTVEHLKLHSLLLLFLNSFYSPLKDSTTTQLFNFQTENCQCLIPFSTHHLTCREEIFHAAL